MNTREALNQLKKLASEIKSKQIEAGELILFLVNNGYEKQFLAEQMGFSRRQVYHLYNVAHALEEGLIRRKDVDRLGFTRAAFVVPFIKKGMPAKEAIDLAMRTTTQTFYKQARAFKHERLRAFTFMLNDTQYEAATDAMRHFKAVSHGKGLRFKEEAFMAILNIARLAITVKKETA